jgi:DNA processing protein
MRGGLKKPIKLYPESKAREELEKCRKIGADIITFIDHEYPKLLRQIADPPPILTIRGDVSLLNRDIIAIVGPRNASINGCKFARMITEELGNANLVISSGMARGIDTVAHKSSLATGTIAVIAGGIDNIYPSENKELYYKIIESGVIISEIQYGALPKGGNFPQRNRIISGLSLGVIVIEATLRSGTLITARFAIEQNREIFAVPGSPFDPRSQGANRLIKQGAKLVEGVHDILEEIDNMRTARDYELEFRDKDVMNFIGFEEFLLDDSEIDEARKLVLEKISYSPIFIDEIISELQISTKVANIVCMQLELADKIENRNGKISLKL